MIRLHKIIFYSCLVMALVSMQAVRADETGVTPAAESALSVITKNGTEALKNTLEAGVYVKDWAMACGKAAYAGFPEMPASFTGKAREAAIHTSAALVQLSKAGKDLASWMTQNKTGGLVLMTGAGYTAYKLGLLNGCGRCAKHTFRASKQKAKNALYCLVPNWLKSQPKPVAPRFVTKTTTTTETSVA